MFPSTHRDTLLHISDRTGRSDVLEGAARVVTRSSATLGGGRPLPTADWVVIDGDVLESSPPPWIEALPDDTYVLASADTVPEWVAESDLSVLDPTLVEFVTRAATSPGETRSTESVTDAIDRALGSLTNGSHLDSTPDPPSDGDPAVENGLAVAATDSAVANPSTTEFASLSAVPFPIALVDGDGVIRMVNRAWRQFGAENGRDPELSDVGSSYFDVCDGVDDVFATSAARAIRRVIEGDSDGERVEYPCHGPQQRRWFSMGVIPVEDADPVRALIFHYDISRYQRRINVLDRVLRHNLRNKANIILGHAAALASARDDETATAATTIGAAARELLSLSEQARRYREASTDDRPTTPVDLVAIVSEVTERLSDRHPHAVIETSLPATAVVDGTQSLSLVVHELVENAIVHNDSTEPWVRVEVVPVHEGGDERVSVRVVDDGPGIPEADRRLLTGGLEEHPIRHGSQLGVWVVSSLVTSLDGKVSVEPRSPRGSAVTATFPSVVVED